MSQDGPGGVATAAVMPGGAPTHAESRDAPLVSVIMPVYNEVDAIEAVLESVLGQRLDGYRLEVLVIDGKSTDGSLAKISELARRDSRLRVFVNEKRWTPHAFNLGLREARGEFVCILGAHSRYATDYIEVCLEELVARGAVGCSGRVIARAANGSLGARLSYWAMSHPFGVSSESCRTGREGFVDTIAYPVFRKGALLAVGGYDEALSRNQDNDMNYRLRQAGHRLYSTWRTSCEYVTRPSVAKLLEYGFLSGWWCAANVRRNPRSLGLRHYVPFLFVLSLLGGLSMLVTGTLLGSTLLRTLGAIGLAALPAHLLVGGVVGASVAVRHRDIGALLLPLVFLAFHAVYGIGFLRGLGYPPDRMKASRS